MSWGEHCTFLCLVGHGALSRLASWVPRHRTCKPTTRHVAPFVVSL